jgi:hypothetical protein
MNGHPLPYEHAVFAELVPSGPASEASVSIDAKTSGPSTTLRSAALSICLLVLILGIARFMHSPEFGLYEDDWTLIPRVMAMSLGEYLRLVIGDLARLYPHGRPLSNAFIYMFTFLGTGHGFLGLYVLGYLVVSANAAVFYLLVRRLSGQGYALAAGIAFVLYSADTTQAYLTHSYALHPSLLFSLIGLHMYLSGRRAGTYVMAVLVLLTYEVPYLLLLAAPLLCFPWERRTLRRLGENALMLGLILAGVYLLRTATGDTRAEGLGFPQILILPITHVLEGPPVALGTYLYRPIQALRGLDMELAVVTGICFFAFYLLLLRIRVEGWGDVRMLVSRLREERRRAVLSLFRGDAGRSGQTSPALRVFQLILVGLVLLALAYPLTFTVRAYAISGRDTRVHFAAVVGCGLVVGGASWLALAYGDATSRRGLVAGLLAAVFALLAGFGVLVQRDYRLAWEYQRQFWTELLPLVSDAGEGDVVLVEPDGLRDTRQIAANYWNLPRILEQLYVFPAVWSLPPRVYRLSSDWESSILSADGGLQLNAESTVAPPLYYGEVECSNVIFIETRGGVLRRRTQAPSIGGEELCQYPPAAPSHPVASTQLYELVVESRSGSP